MSSPIGLPDLIITGQRETWARVYLRAEPGVAICARCGSSDGLSDPMPANPVVVADTPSRGRPTEILVTRYRYRCTPCARTFTNASRDVHQRRKMTHRLIRYIENSSFRRPRSAIAAEVGIADHRVDSIVLDLSERLAEHHRFPTPRVLGIDDLKMNRKTYTVFTNAETGYAIGLISSGEYEKARHWFDTRVGKEVSRVQILVTDLGKTNLALARWRFRSAVHVGDPWHLLRASQKALGKVIAQELNALVWTPRPRSMLALYEPWQLDVDIVECGTCHRIEGPASLVPDVIGQERDQPPETRSDWRCASCSPPAFAAVQAA